MFCVSAKVKLIAPLLCVCVHSAWKGRPRTMSGGTLNPTHSLTLLGPLLLERNVIDLSIVRPYVTNKSEAHMCNKKA